MTHTTILLSSKIFSKYIISLEYCCKDLWFGIYWEKYVFYMDIYFGIPFIVFHIRRFKEVWMRNQND